MRFGLEVWVVAVEPIDTAVRVEVRLIQQAPDTRTTHGPEALILKGGDQVVEIPACSRAMVRGGFTRCHRQHIQTRCGGKSAAADPGAAHRAGHGGRLADSAYANGQQYGGYSGTPWPPED